MTSELASAPTPIMCPPDILNKFPSCARLHHCNASQRNYGLSLQCLREHFPNVYRCIRYDLQEGREIIYDLPLMTACEQAFGTTSLRIYCKERLRGVIGRKKHKTGDLRKCFESYTGPRCIHKYPDGEYCTTFIARPDSKHRAHYGGYCKKHIPTENAQTQNGLAEPTFTMGRAPTTQQRHPRIRKKTHSVGAMHGGSIGTPFGPASDRGQQQRGIRDAIGMPFGQATDRARGAMGGGSIGTPFGHASDRGQQRRGIRDAIGTPFGQATNKGRGVMGGGSIGAPTESLSRKRARGPSDRYETDKIDETQLAQALLSLKKYRKF